MSTFLINQIQQNPLHLKWRLFLTMPKNREGFHWNPFFGCQKTHPLKRRPRAPPTTTPSSRQVSKKIFAAPPVSGTVTGSSLKPCANKAKIAEVLGVFQKNTPNIRNNSLTKKNRPWQLQPRLFGFKKTMHNGKVKAFLFEKKRTRPERWVVHDGLINKNP